MGCLFVFLCVFVFVLFEEASRLFLLFLFFCFLVCLFFGVVMYIVVTSYVPHCSLVFSLCPPFGHLCASPSSFFVCFLYTAAAERFRKFCEKSFAPVFFAFLLRRRLCGGVRRCVASFRCRVGGGINRVSRCSPSVGASGRGRRRGCSRPQRNVVVPSS